MNKQEVIKAIEGNLDENCDEVFDGYVQGCEFCMALIVQIDEHKKVVIPQFMAEYLKIGKEKDAIGGLGAAITLALNTQIHPKLAKWMNNNVETFVRAWLDGYEVEQEQLYVIYLPSIGYVTEPDYGDYVTNAESEARRFTKKELKEFEGCYWEFALKVKD